MSYCYIVLGSKTTNGNVGRLGEDIACGYLVEKGYNILRQNVRSKWGELDIVAKHPDQTLVFVEVKTMTRLSGLGGWLTPEDQMTFAKLDKFKRAAEMFVAENSDLIDERRGWRMDLIAVDLIAGNGPKIRHYENII